MERLIGHALMYGSMAQVDQPHLIERYNHALEAFGIPKTKRTSLRLDATGFSPEVAEDLQNEQYLDPRGVNRRFIIVTPEQAQVPVVNINFSATIDFMRNFYRHNSEAVKILTLKDVIYGEIENSTYKIDDIDDILAIKRVKFQLNTHGKLLEKSERLTELMTRFRTEEDSWKDNALIHSILELAKECGDTRYNQIVPRHLSFAANSFWTKHFGGVYVFHDKDDKAVVIGNLARQKQDQSQREGDRFIPMKNRRTVFNFLRKTKRIEPINLNWLKRSGMLETRLDLFIRDQIARREPERPLAYLSSTDIKNWLHDNIGALRKQPEFRLYSELRSMSLNRDDDDDDDDDDDEFDFEPELELMAVRGNPNHPDCDLVNRFLAEYVPFDFLTRFIVNKPAFYLDYGAMSEQQKEHAIEVITSKFFPDRDRMWDNFFSRWSL